MLKLLNIFIECKLMKILTEKVCDIAIKAGESIMSFYSQEIDYITKEDKSPLTKADLSSHEIISNDLNLLSNKLNVLSEESKNIDWEERKNWNPYWLVDPLDGTKEFIKKNGEFTVNIALIENNIPIMGVIYAPFLKTIYYSLKNCGAYKHANISLKNRPIYFDKSNAIKCNQNIKVLNVVASRSHHSELLDNWLKDYKDFNLMDAGSSLKFCLVAEGSADVYPRFVGSSEWDIAAGCSILLESGGSILDINKNEILFNKASIRNEFFIASSKSFLSY